MPKSQFKCGDSAACFMGAGLPPSQLRFLSFAPAAAPASDVPAADVDFISSGPYRPPRHLVAS
jgi:hypothetical protein